MITKQIKSLRPSLRKVAPLTWWICLGFSLVNMLIFLLLVTANPENAAKAQVPTAPSYAWFVGWAFWFLFLSLEMAYGLLRNNWRIIKQALVLGLMSKLIWTYSLIYMVATGYPTFSTLILWSFLAWVQAWTIVFFVPTIGDDAHTVLPENGGETK